MRTAETNQDEIPKYIKKKRSNISDSKNKTDHKHQYSKCLLIYKERPYLANYCTKCGRVRDWEWCRKKCENGYMLLRDDEVYELYKDLIQFRVDDIYLKNLSILLNTQEED